jgi:integrase
MSKAVWTTPKICDHGSNLNEPWYIHFRYTNPATGKRKQFRFKKGINYYTTLEDRRREAKKLLNELKELLKEGWNPWKNEIEKPRSLGSTLQEMYNLKEATLRKESKRTYLYKFKHFTGWLKDLGYDQWLPGEFNNKQAFEYLDYCSGCGFTGRYFNYHRENASMLFNMMEKREIITVNPFSKTARQKVKKASSTIFTEAQINQVRKHLRLHNMALGIFCDYVYYTFLRPKELIQIQIKHFDFTRYRINLTPEIAKNDDVRVVTIPPALHWHIDQLRDGGEKYLAKYSKKHPGAKYEDAYIFGYGVALHPKPLVKRDSVSDKFRLQARIPLGLSEEHTLYVFKHSGVDAALKKGYSIPATMKQTGHKSLKNFQIYIRSLNHQDNEEFETADF